MTLPTSHDTIQTSFFEFLDCQTLPAVFVGAGAIVLGASPDLSLNNPSEGRVDWGFIAQLDYCKINCGLSSLFRLIGGKR